MQSLASQASGATSAHSWMCCEEDSAASRMKKTSGLTRVCYWQSSHRFFRTPFVSNPSLTLHSSFLLLFFSPISLTIKGRDRARARLGDLWTDNVQEVFDCALVDAAAEVAAAARGEEYNDGHGMSVCRITYEGEDEAEIGATADGGDDGTGDEGQVAEAEAEKEEKKEEEKGEEEGEDADNMAQRHLETRVVKYLKNEGLSPFSAKVAFGFLQGQLHKDGGFDRMNHVNRFLQVLSYYYQNRFL